MNWTREIPSKSEHGTYFLIQQIGTDNIELTRWTNKGMGEHEGVFVNIKRPNFYKPSDKRYIWAKINLYKGKLEESIIRDKILCLVG